MNSIIGSIANSASIISTSFIPSSFSKDSLFVELKQFSKTQFLCVLYRLEIFYFEISGENDNDTQPLKINLISSIFVVFHFDISGKYINDLHP